jgi:hypothetical protein
MPLDADLPNCIFSPNYMWKILADPFGYKALFKNVVFPDTNRFIVPLTISTYFRNMPIFLQHFFSPITSVYLSCAIIKSFTQFIILYSLSKAISGFKRIYTKDFLLSALIITPLFQTSGFNRTMGIIDQSITYTFYYALPISFLLIYLLFFYKAFLINNFKLNVGIQIFLIVLAIILSFNGPLIPGIVVIIFPLIILSYWRIYFERSYQIPLVLKCYSALNKIPRQLLINFSIFCFICLYSLYISFANSSIFASINIPIMERYSRLPIGIYNELMNSIAFPILFLVIIINLLIIKFSIKAIDFVKTLKLIKWICLFSLIYIILLPLGGYRTYRPNIIRYDTFMPVTLGIIFIFGISTFFILYKSFKFKKLYISFIVAILLIFTIADSPNFEGYNCERNAFEDISTSPNKIVILNCNCSVFDWGKITDYHNSEKQGKALKLLGITKDEKLYYQK